jgi:hypothetical protein
MAKKQLPAPRGGGKPTALRHDPESGRFIPVYNTSDVVNRPCAQCGRVFRLSPAQVYFLRSGKRVPKHGFCCSPHCSGLLGHPTSDPVLHTCANCSKKFFARPASPSVASRSLKYGRCCSKSCATLVGHRHRGTARSQLTPRQFARIVLNRALRAGELVRPERCERCGKPPGLDSWGRSLIHGHHHDYNKPLEVAWVCVRCHNNDPHHPRYLGSARQNSKLTEAQSPTIRRLLRRRVPQRDIAMRFGVSESTVLHIKQGLVWRHVNG